jgi:uncharacterized RDD family membrane protein YckC
MENRIGFGRRLGAYLIDLLIILGLAYIVASISGSFFERFVDFSKFTDAQLEVFDGKPNLWLFSVIVPVTAVLMSFIYNLVEGFTGYTFAKYLLGIQIGNQDGTKASQGKLMGRFAIKNISSIIGLIAIALMATTLNTIGSVLGFVIIIGCFFVLGESKLAFHDMLAKTAVYWRKDLEGESAEA